MANFGISSATILERSAGHPSFPLPMKTKDPDRKRFLSKYGGGRDRFRSISDTPTALTYHLRKRRGYILTPTESSAKNRTRVWQKCGKRGGKRKKTSTGRMYCLSGKVLCVPPPPSCFSSAALICPSPLPQRSLFSCLQAPSSPLAPTTAAVGRCLFRNRRKGGRERSRQSLSPPSSSSDAISERTDGK